MNDYEEFDTGPIPVRLACGCMSDGRHYWDCPLTPTYTGVVCTLPNSRGKIGYTDPFWWANL